MIIRQLLRGLFIVIVACSLASCKPPTTFDVIDAQTDDAKNTIDRQEQSGYIRPAPVLTQSGPYVDTKKISLQASPAWLKQRVTLRGSH